MSENLDVNRQWFMVREGGKFMFLPATAPAYANSKREVFYERDGYSVVLFSPDNATRDLIAGLPKTGKQSARRIADSFLVDCMDEAREVALAAVYEAVKRYMALHFAAQLLDAHVTSEVTDSTAEALADFLREMEKSERATAARFEVDANLNLSGTKIAEMEAQAHRDLSDPDEDEEEQAQ